MICVGIFGSDEREKKHRVELLIGFHEVINVNERLIMCTFKINRRK